MNLFSSFSAHLEKDFPYVTTRQTKLLLAVSGGVDSVVLTHLLAKAGFDFILAHCNFHLRGAESDRDELFVRNLAQELDKPLLVQHFDTETYAKQTKSSIEQAARSLRYSWFGQLLNDASLFHLSLSNKFIVTAHHGNDSVETLLMNFFRGCGIAGLHGIPLRNDQVIRPLLFANREEINTYAVENGLGWIEDSTNQSELYTRNFFRLNFLPSVQQYFPQVNANLLANIERFKEVEVLYKEAVQMHQKKLLKQIDNEFFISIALLKKSAAYQTILWEMVKGFSFTHAQVAEIVKLFVATTGAHIDSTSHRIFKNRKHLIITPLKTIISLQILIQEGEREVLFEGGKIEFFDLAPQNCKIDSSPNVAMLDADKITYPLILRKWAEGDYFYPLGMKKKKKLGRFFIDQKYSLSQKQAAWLLQTEQKVAWIVGRRIDDRMKVTDNTKRILKLSLSQTNV